MDMEHETRMEALAAALGFDALAKLVPFPVERIRAALEAGDEHLNTLPLARWDCAALNRPFNFRDEQFYRFGDWPEIPLRLSASDKSLPWHKRPSSSLSDRVCVLKYVARRLALGTLSGDAR